MKHLSLTENHLFSKAYAGGSKFRGRFICVYVLKDYAARRLMQANPEKKYLNRVGISTSKKLGGAVVRSRVRRIIRAALQTIEAEGLRSGYIIVIAAREAATDRKSTEICGELRTAFKKLNMLSNPDTQQK